MESGFRNFIFEIVVKDFQDFISEIASDTPNIVDQRLLQMGERIKLKGEGTEAEIQLPLKRSSRFQRLFPNSSWLV